jgi:hypothetical protein
MTKMKTYNYAFHRILDWIFHDSSVPFKVNPKPDYALVCRVGQKDKLIVTEQLQVQFWGEDANWAWTHVKDLHISTKRQG